MVRRVKIRGIVKLAVIRSCASCNGIHNKNLGFPIQIAAHFVFATTRMGNFVGFFTGFLFFFYAIITVGGVCGVFRMQPEGDEAKICSKLFDNNKS